MRDECRIIQSEIMRHTHKRLKKVFTIILVLVLLITLLPSSLGKFDSDKKFSYIIEFSSPSIFKIINYKSDQSVEIHSFFDILLNITNYQHNAIEKIKDNIKVDICSNEIDHYKLLINGIKINDLSASMANKIASLPFVKLIEKDMKIQKNDLSSKLSYEPHFSYNMTHFSNSTNIISEYSGKNISIAFFDTGVDYSHQALSSSYCGGYDFVNDDFDPYDDNGHGTHVIGITAASGMQNNNLMSGIAPNASVYIYKVLDEEGNGYTSWFLSAFEHALDPNQDGNFSDHVNIISISAGNPSGSESDLLSTAAMRAVQSGITVVAAAGNSGPDMKTINSPAIASKVIAVGA